MRISAISILSVSLLLSAQLLSGCAVEPPLDMGKELGKLEGPKPGSVDSALESQAKQAKDSGNFASAAQTYKQLADKNPSKREYALGLAESLRHAGDDQGAVRVLSDFLVANPGDPSALELRGMCQMNLGNLGDAQRDLEEVTKADNTRWRTLNALGILSTIKNELPQAVEYYDQALMSNPGNISAQNNKGLALAMQGKLNDAIETMTTARQRMRADSPDVRQVDMNLALIYAIAGKLDDAEATASRHLTKAALYNNMGVFSDLARNPSMARSYLNMALTQSPTYYERAWKNLSAVNDESKGEMKKPKITKIDKQSAETIINEARKESAKAAEEKPKEEKPKEEWPKEEKPEDSSAKDSPAAVAPTEGSNAGIIVLPPKE